MGIRVTTATILTDLEEISATHGLDGRAVGLAIWGLRLGERPEAPFDQPGAELDALTRFMWLLLVRFPAQESTGLITSMLRLEMLMGGLEPLAQIAEDLKVSARISADLVTRDNMPPSWTYSANALRDVLRRTGDDLLLLVFRPLRDLQPSTDAPRVAAIEASADPRLRRYLDTGDAQLTIAPEPGRDRAELGLHLAWTGQVDLGHAAIDEAVQEGVPAWLGARMRASTLYRAGQLERAVDAFEEVLTLRPAADAAYDLASCLTELGRFDEADAAYGRAAQLDPSWPAPLWDRGKLRMEHLKDMDGARADTEAAIALDPLNPDLRFNLATVDAEAGHGASALAHLGEALRLSPENPSILLNRARMRRSLEQFEAALTDVRRARAADDTPLARVVEARVLRDLDRLEESSRAWDRALEEINLQPSIFAEAAAVKAKLGQRERAILLYRIALREAPEGSPVIAPAEAALEELDYNGPRTWPLPQLSDAEAMARARQADPEAYRDIWALVDRADALAKQGEPREAEQLLLAWLADHEAPEIWGSLAILRRNLRDAAGALYAAERAIALDPDRVLPRAVHIEILTALGRFDEAVEGWSAIEALRPNVPEVCHRRAHALEQAGRFEEALAGYERALELEPGNDDTHYNRAVALGHLERLPEALQAYDGLLAMKPDDLEGRLNRATLRFQTGDVGGAIADLDDLIAHRPSEGRAWAKRSVFRQFVRDDWGTLFDALVGYELLEPGHPYQAAPATCAEELLATLDPAVDGIPARAELLGAAHALLEHAARGEEAVLTFFDALERPLGSRPELWAVRAKLGEMLGMPSKQCAAWRQYALQIDPNHAYARFVHADALVRADCDLEEEVEAEGLLRGALTGADPLADADWHMQAHLRLGRLNLDGGKLEAAAEVLEAGLDLDAPFEERDRTAAHIAFLLGYVRSKQDDTEGALAAYTRGLDLDPSKTNLWFNRACEHARRVPEDPAHRALALADLAEAMERHADIGRDAEEDEYFRPLWNDPEFRALVALRPMRRRAS